MKVIIDRFEEGFAVCEDEYMSITHIPINKIPPEAIEGDILEVDGDNIIIDVEATQTRRAELEELFNS